MNKIFTATVLLFGLGYFSHAQLIYSLDDIISKAGGQSIRAKQAETRKENLYWSYRFFRSNYNPQLRVNGNAPGFNRDFFELQLDSTYFVARQRTNYFINLGLEQPISMTGGTVSINTDVNRSQNFLFSTDNWTSTLVNIRLNQPIFGFNRLKWDKRTEPLRFEESKRAYVEEMEFISRTATQLFFNYMEAQVNLGIAEFNLSKQDTIYRIEQGRYNIGTTSRDKLLQVELQLLRTRQGVTQANQDLQNAELQLRSYIGLQDETANFSLTLPENIPEFVVTVDEALQYGRSNRADFIAFERRRMEAARDLEQAKRSRFNINMLATYGLTNTGASMSDSYVDPNDQQRFNLAFDIPIMDWGRTKARTRTALANKQLTDFTIAQEEQTFEQEIITQVQLFDVLRSQIEISKKSDEVAQERYLVAQNQYLIGKIDITNLNIALQEKDDAKRSYLQALRDFWIAYYDLRRLTLYDFVNRQLLYRHE